MLKEKLTVLTKSITTLNESFKNDRLMKLMRIKKQCEDVSMPLGCMGLENGSHKEKVECVLEEENMEVSLTSLEPQSVCAETQDKGLVRDEPELEVGVEKSKSLKVSLLSDTRRRSAVVGMLSCNCEDDMKELEDHQVDELLGLEVGHNVTMMGKEEQLGLVMGKRDDGDCMSACLKASSLLDYETLCPTFGRSVLGGKIYNLLTPHYHCNMLVRLMERLLDINAAMSLFEGSNIVFCFNLSHLAVLKFCWVLVVESFFGLNCLSLTMIELNLLCPDDGVILLSTWESIRGTKREKQKSFYVQIPEVNDVMEYHGVWLDGVLEGYFQCQLDGIWGIHSHCYVERLFAGCGKGEHMRNLFKPNTTGFRRLNQWVKSVWDYDLPWFKWFVMITVGNGVVSYLRSGGGLVLMCVDGEKGSEVAIIHKCSFAYNDSSCKWRMESQLLVAVRMQLWDSNGEVYKVQSKAAQSIGKWLDIAVLDVKATKEISKGSIAGPLFLKAKSVKTIKDEIEWMIAWEEQPTAAVINEERFWGMIQWN